jgi:arsenate reductase (glutaredoxin)
MIQIFGQVKCTATRAAQRFFSERKLKVQFVDLRERALSPGELQAVSSAVGGALALWDGAGKRVRERGLQHIEPSEERLSALLLEDPLLLRTPIVRLGPKAVVGKDEAGWKALATEARAAGEG